jgi:hypothetical protein
MEKFACGIQGAVRSASEILVSKLLKREYLGNKHIELSSGSGL